MSSRALRRLQREQEEERQRQQADASSEEEEESPIQPIKKSAFDMLGAMGAEDDDSDDADDVPPHVRSSGASENLEGEHEDEDDQPAASKPAKKSKAKKKKKKKSKAKDSPKPQEGPREDADLDEIDRALKALGTTANTKGGTVNLVIDQDLSAFYSLLAVDKQHLNALNEMKKLFGSVVLERDDEEDADAARRQMTNQGVDVGTFLSARFSRVSNGQGLSGLALRQNAFMVGKTGWPKAPSGGLSMELVERADDFTTEYRFVHNGAYQRVQRDFEAAVRTMDPQQIFHMVFNNPYHISSLLQAAEVLKHQGDGSVATDLYERALYNFGRSVQSTFSAALAAGKARMDFRRPENREFWLTVYRYIGALIQRGTFRTAYEWAKLLLSLDPEGDPYCVRLLIDQLALRGGQAEHLIKLAATKTDIVDWGQDAPNVQISLCLAHYRMKDVGKAKEMLAAAVRSYPWMFTRLYQGLDISETPKTIWGAQPRSGIEKYQTESYASRAKDVWNTPETSAFLNEVVKSVDKTNPESPDQRSITLDEARHAILSENTSLIGTVPREYTTMPTTAADPLPPPDSMPLYNTVEDRELDSDEESELDQREINRAINQVRQNMAAGGGQGTGVMGLLGRALNMFTGRGGAAPQDPAAGPEESLGAQMGMEEVQVRTMQEYEDALNRGQWPVLDEAAAPEILRELERQGVVQAGGNSSPGESEEQRLARRAEEAEAVREAQSRRQATVEDEDDDIPASTEAPSQPVAPQQSMGSMTRQEIVEHLSKDYDNDSNKRWLAGRGMLGLKDFVATNGADEKVWLADPRVDKAPVTEYLARVSLLKSSQDKNFILEYALKQGAGAPASDLVRRLL